MQYAESDVHGFDGSSGRRIPPIIMGHEASGIIEEVGENVNVWQAGDRVTFDSTIYCGECWYCRRSKVNLCDNRRVLGVSCTDYCQPGAMAEFVNVPQHILYRLPENVSYEHAAMIEPLSVAVHAVKHSAVKLNDTALGVGAGMIGALIIQVLKLVGCGCVIATDLAADRLQTAQKHGADICLKSDACNVSEEVIQLTGGRGADIVFEAVGITATFNTACASTRRGGSIVLVGNVAKTVDFPLQSIVTREIHLDASCASAGEYEDCLALISRGKVSVDPFISAIAPLKDGGEWFERLYAAEPGLVKVILQP